MSKREPWQKHLATIYEPWHDLGAYHLTQAALWRQLGFLEDARDHLQLARDDRGVLVRDNGRGEVTRERALPA